MCFSKLKTAYGSVIKTELKLKILYNYCYIKIKVVYIQKDPSTHNKCFCQLKWLDIKYILWNELAFCLQQKCWHPYLI